MASAIGSNYYEVAYFLYDTERLNINNYLLGDLVDLDPSGNLGYSISLTSSLLWPKGPNYQITNIFTTVTPIKSDGTRYLFVTSDDYIYVYDLDENGIILDENKSFRYISDEINSSGLSEYLAGSSGGRGEIEVIENSTGYRLLFTSTIQKYYPNSITDYEILKSVFVYDLDANANRIFQNVGGQMIDRKGRYDFRDWLAVNGDPHILHGVEFTSENNFLMNKSGTHFLTGDNKNLYYFSLSVNPSDNSIVISNDLVRNFTDFSESQIEKGVDGNYYMVNDSELLQLTGTYPSIIQSGTIPVNYVASGIPSNETFTLPNQVDNEDYSDRFSSPCCYSLDKIVHSYMANQTYLVWDGLTLQNPFGQDEIVIKEDLIFPSGGFWEISDMIIRFEEDARLIIERGATVKFDNCILTSRCDEFLWSGVEVKGNPTVTQSYPTDYGRLFLYDSEISNAKVGVRMYATNTNYGVDFGTTGGQIYAENTSFLNNISGVVFMNYNFNNKSKFRNCHFVTSRRLNNDEVPVGHVRLVGTDGVNFLGCTFENTAPSRTFYNSQKGVGISAFDSYFRVNYNCNSTTLPCPSQDWDRSIFSNLGFGIFASASNPLNSCRIVNSEFVNCERGIYLGGVDYAVIGDNNMEIGLPDDPSVYSYGVYLNQCTGYRIEGNEFKDLINANSNGIIVNNSNNNGFSPDVNYIYRNTFREMSQGIVAIYSNVKIKQKGSFFAGPDPKTGVKFKCNEFYNSKAVDIGVDLGGTFGGVSPIQGTCTTGSSGANNLFSTVTPSIGHFWNTNNLFPVNYRHNSTGSNTYELVEYNIQNTSVATRVTPFDPSKGCPVSRFKIGTREDIKKEIENLKYEASLVEQELNDIDAEFDHLWNQASSGQMSWGHFKNNTVDLTPLISEDDVIEMIASNQIPGGILKQVLVANSPLSEATINEVQNANISNGIKNNILSAQTPRVISAREEYENLGSDLLGESRLYLNELIRDYIHDTTIISMDSIEKVLMKQEDVYYKCQLANVKIKKKEYSEAQVLVDSLRVVDAGMHTEFCKLRDLLIEFDQVVENCFIIRDDVAKEVRLDDVAANDPKERNCFQANEILRKVYGYDYQEELHTLVVSKMANTTSSKTYSFEEVSSVYVYPNPAKDIISVEFSAEDYEIVSIEITNINGQFIRRINSMSSGDWLDVSEMAKGVYLLTITSNEDLIETIKLVLVD